MFFHKFSIAIIPLNFLSHPHFTSLFNSEILYVYSLTKYIFRASNLTKKYNKTKTTKKNHQHRQLFVYISSHPANYKHGFGFPSFAWNTKHSFVNCFNRIILCLLPIFFMYRKKTQRRGGSYHTTGSATSISVVGPVFATTDIRFKNKHRKRIFLLLPTTDDNICTAIFSIFTTTNTNANNCFLYGSYRSATAIFSLEKNYCDF